MNTNQRTANWFFNSIVRMLVPIAIGSSFVRHSVFWLLLPTANCLLPTFSCEAQSDALKYARQIIDTLCSPSMHGRGYVNKGDSIAADYIKKEFEKFGLKPIGKEFYQMFSFPINTITDINYKIYYVSKMYDGWLEYPYFLVHPSSPSVKGKFKVNTISSKQLKNEADLFFLQQMNFKNRFLVIDTLNIKEKEKIKLFENLISNPPKGIKGILVYNQVKSGKDALSWGISQAQMNFPILELTKEDAIRKLKIDLKTKFTPNYLSKNILGYMKGSQYPDSFIVFSAHYDHLGQMGKEVYFPGANDNASGCAMLLNLARHYSRHPPKYSIAFFAFGAEEVGLLGSKYYVEHPLFPLKQIKFLVNMDIMGTGDEGIKVVNATEHKNEFDALVRLNSEKNLLPSVQPRGKAQNSDHYFFEEAGVKTFFIYTLGGITAYHDIYDRPETLPLSKFEEVYKLLLDFTDYLQK